MPYTTPQLDCATAVAALLNGASIADFTLRVRATDTNPIYEKKDLAELKVDVVAPADFALSRLDRGTANEQCIVNVGIQFACERDDEPMKARLRYLTRRIALILEAVALADFGLPVDDVEVEEIDEMLARGHYFGIVAAPYRVQTDLVGVTP